MDVPGVKGSNIELELNEQNVLKIQGECNIPWSLTKSFDWITRWLVDVERLTASLDNGVLLIHIPKLHIQKDVH